MTALDDAPTGAATTTATDHETTRVEAALDALLSAAPGVRRVVLFGLCDAASMAMIYAPTRPEVTGLVLLNPWVHEGEYLPEVRLSRYRSQLAVGQQWRRLVSRPGALAAGLAGFASAGIAALRRRLFRAAPAPTFVAAMRKGLTAFQGPALVLLSEDDLTAQEFAALVARDAKWREVLARPGFETCEVAGMDHTFSRPGGQEQLQERVADWLAGLD
ncbi:MAG: hydrolase 1, exosortase A system-associated [Halioglobus sp.]|nr:hydrolase 1, exosortase A system-associated [Halioglobus sp.]